MTFIDLFAGIGGFRVGLERLGHKCVFSSETDKYARETYRANFKEYPAGDIREISASEIPDHDILCAGFPCQSFSTAGKKKGFSDERGFLFFEIICVLKEKKPKVFILENVKNLQKIDKGRVFRQILKELKGQDYFIQWKILNSCMFGVPQARERVFIVGFKALKDWMTFKFPEGEMTKHKLKNFLQKITPENQDRFTSGEGKLFLTEKALAGVKRRKRSQIYNEEDKFGTITTRTGASIRQVLWVAVLNKGRQGERVYSQDRYSITLSAQGGGVGGKTGLYETEYGIRRLSVRECARLQGFSDRFEFPVSDSQAYRQIGNAVTTNVVLAIGEELGRMWK